MRGCTTMPNYPAESTQSCKSPRAKAACFSAKAETQSGLPPSQENKEVRAITTREFAQSLVRLFWTLPMVDRFATVTRHAGMENDAQ